MFFYSFVTIAFFIARLLVGIIAGYWVYKDGCKRGKLEFNIPPFWWGIIVVAEPALGVFAYWIIHHSNLSLPKDNQK